MMSAAEDAARFLHQRVPRLPDRVKRKIPEPRTPHDAFFAATIDACPGLLWIAHPVSGASAFRDAILLARYELTREDLEEQSSLPYADAIEILDFLNWHRASARKPRERAAARTGNTVLAFTGRKREYLIAAMGYLVGNDLYDSYIEGPRRSGRPAPVVSHPSPNNRTPLAKAVRQPKQPPAISSQLQL